MRFQGIASVALAVLALSGGRRAGGGYRLVLVGIGVGATLSGLNTILLVMGDLDRAVADARDGPARRQIAHELTDDEH